ncbi:IS1380 family transposase [Allorhizocola rhizosphaerae]|uniref:IS1380 family transposase n=1 Tax=Allorhizocola rhizosphaerae TaxID=1872709 RepID=UPI001B8CA227|nr:IS1380 family transposase [Allorhizocola rhizosphaerae]
MRLSHGPREVLVRFDEPNLVSCAGLVPVMRLAEQVGLAGLVDGRVRPELPAGARPGGKAAAVVAGMVAGADSIDDLDLLRHGGMKALFDGVYAPSTLGSFLRFFTWGHGLQLEAASRDLLTALAERVPLLPGAAQQVFVDVDSLLRRVYGHAKQGAGFGHAKVGGYKVKLRGLSPLIATISTPAAAPVIAATRLRAGNAASARAAASLVRQAITTARACGADGNILVRGDSSFGSGAVVSACRKAGANFSVTMQSNSKVAAAIAGIDETAWRPVRYPGAVLDETTGQWISDAEVAETAYTAFETTQHKVTARLVVRRVREKNPAPAGQEELFPIWRHHQFLTDDDSSTVEADLTHRAHAIQEQVFADLIDGPLAHLPSGRFAANAAWLTLAAMAHNLTRAAGCRAGTTGSVHAKARAATLINIPARIARHARRLILHLPTGWRWRHDWQRLFTNTVSPPATI